MIQYTLSSDRGIGESGFRDSVSGGYENITQQHSDLRERNSQIFPPVFNIMLMVNRQPRAILFRASLVTIIALFIFLLRM